MTAFDRIAVTSKTVWQQWWSLVHDQSRFSHIGLLTLLSMTGTLLGLVKVLLLTRALPKESFGAWVYAGTFIGLLDTFLYSGINPAVLQYASEGTPGILAAALRERIRYYPLALLIGTGGAGYWFFLRQDLQTAVLLLVVVILYPGTHLTVCVEQSLIGQRRYMLQSWVSLGLDTGSLILASACIYGGGTLAVVWFVAGDGLLRSLTLGILILRERQREQGKVPDTAELVTFRRYARQMTTLTVISSGQERLDGLILGTLLSLSTFSDLALGLQIKEQVKLLWMAYYKTTYAKLAQSTIKQRWLLVKRDIALVVAGFAVVVTGIILASPFVIPLLFSDKYESSVPYIAAILIGFWLFLPGALFETLFRTRQIVWAQFTLRGGLLLITVVLTPLLILGFGAMGAAASRIAIGMAFSVIAVTLGVRIKRRDAETNAPGN